MEEQFSDEPEEMRDLADEQSVIASAALMVPIVLDVPAGA